MVTALLPPAPPLPSLTPPLPPLPFPPAPLPPLALVLVEVVPSSSSLLEVPSSSPQCKLAKASAVPRSKVGKYRMARWSHEDRGNTIRSPVPAGEGFLAPTKTS